jgi:DNA-binding transcriptional ArsR family regulator
MDDKTEIVLPEQLDEVSHLLKMMSNPNRLIVLCALVNHELSVGELNAKVPLSQSALSQQLAFLRKAGLVTSRKEKQTVLYQLMNDNVVHIITLLHQLYCNNEHQ